MKITQWWSKWPNANIGIATDEKSRIFVLDVDRPLHGTNKSKGIDGHNSLEDLLNDHASPDQAAQQVSDKINSNDSSLPPVALKKNG